jgi:DNA-binding XRE family transcriptional regulator
VLWRTTVVRSRPSAPTALARRSRRAPSSFEKCRKSAPSRRRGLSQEELGTESGVSRVTVGSIERGDHPASVLAYRRLARAFGVRVSELLDGEP